MSFALGAVSIALFWQGRRNSKAASIWTSTRLSDQGILRRCLIGLSLLAAMGVVVNWSILLSHYGSVIGVFANFGRLRQAIVFGELSYPSLAGYIGSLAYAAAPIGGLYLTRVSKRNLWAYVPFAEICLLDIANAGRAGIVLTFLLYFNAFLLARAVERRRIKAGKVLIGMLAAGLIVYVGLNAVRRAREGADLSYQPDTIATFNLPQNLLFQSLIPNFIYLTGSIPAFSEFVKEYESAPDYGAAMFAPIIRLAARLGIRVSGITYYYEPVQIPFAFNTYTYLREAYTGFGFLGVLFVPYAVSLLISFLYFKGLGSPNPLILAVLSYCYTFLEFSPLVNTLTLASFCIGAAILVLLSFGVSSPVKRINTSASQQTVELSPS
jgi:hypothetical protein